MLFIEAIESVKCLDEGVIETVADANIGSIMGIGFPGWTGGVLQYINGYEGGLPGFVSPRARARRAVRRALHPAGLAGRARRARRAVPRRREGRRHRRPHAERRIPRPQAESTAGLAAVGSGRARLAPEAAPCGAARGAARRGHRDRRLPGLHRRVRRRAARDRPGRGPRARVRGVGGGGGGGRVVRRLQRGPARPRRGGLPARGHRPGGDRGAAPARRAAGRGRVDRRHRSTRTRRRRSTPSSARRRTAARAGARCATPCRPAPRCRRSPSTATRAATTCATATTACPSPARSGQTDIDAEVTELP